MFRNIYSSAGLKHFCRTLIICTMPFVHTGCSHLLYFPTHAKYVDESQLETPPEEVVFAKQGETELHAWLFTSKHRVRRNVTVIYFHGNGQNMSAHFRGMYWLLDHGYDIFIFDYPGYGPNTGEPTPTSTVESGKQAMDWIEKKQSKSTRFVILGQSLGGNVALRSLSEKPEFPHCQVIIESSFLSYKKVAQNVMKKGWLSWPFQWLPYLVLSDQKAASTNLEELPESNYLVIHGNKDPQVDIDMGRQLYESLPSKKTFWEIKGGDHIDTFVRHKEYRPKLLTLLEENCSDDDASPAK